MSAPTAEDNAIFRASSTGSETTAPREARILLVEDNITTQHLVLCILQKLGIKADTAAHGVEALKAVGAAPYDLVLMDVQMPVMDGIEATRQIRSSQSSCLNPGVRIIAMTAGTVQDDREKCRGAGMDDYVSKPMTPQALARCLDQWLPGDCTRAKRLIELSGREKSPEPHPGPPIWDRSGMMERLMDDGALAKKLLEGFFSDIPQQLSALRAYQEAGDPAGVERQSHSIKGASDIVGGVALRAVAFEIERRGKSRELGGADALISKLEGEFYLLRDLVQRERQPAPRTAGGLV